MRIEMVTLKVVGSAGVKEWVASVSELFDHDEEAASKVVDKHHSFPNLIDLDGVMQEAFNKDWIQQYEYKTYDLGNGDFVLTVAYLEKE